MIDRPSRRRAGRRGGRPDGPPARRPAARPGRRDEPFDAGPATARLVAAGELALGVAHTLANVLGALRMRIGTVPAQAPEEVATVRELSRLAEEATALVSNLQTLGRSAPHARVTDVARVAHDAVALARARFRLERHAPVTIDVDMPALPAALAQADELRLVVVELLLNARDALPRGGHVAVHADATDEMVRVRVEDDGPGIALDDLPRVFDLFFTTKGDGGTGIGLASARDLLRRMGGSIEARNRPEGGACFEVSLLRAAGGDRKPAAG